MKQLRIEAYIINKYFKIRVKYFLRQEKVFSPIVFFESGYLHMCLHDQHLLF